MDASVVRTERCSTRSSRSSVPVAAGVVLGDVQELPLGEAAQRGGQVGVLQRGEPADVAQPGAYVVEAQRGLEAFVGVGEGVQDRGVEVGAVADGEAEHLRWDPLRYDTSRDRLPVMATVTSGTDRTGAA